MDTTHRTPLATAGRVLAGVVTAVAAALHAFLWWFISAWQCDESCDGGSWHSTAGAWQWTALGVLGFVSFVLAVGFAATFAARRSPRVWGTLLGAAAATALAPWILLSA